MNSIEEKYILTIKKQILEDLEDLRNKIENNESTPEKEQDINMLVEISDNIEACLNNWYY